VSKKHLMLQNISSQDYDKNYNKDKKYNILNFTLIPLNNKLPDLKQHTMTPDKHYGYAATWLGLFIVSLCFTYSVFRRKKS
jgi:cytochrome oxidase assembly protein ShyY1